MTCEKCRAAYNEVGDEQKQTAERMQDVDNGRPCPCEEHCMSDYSAGPVRDEETIHFLLTEPQALTQDGEIDPTIFMQMYRSGLSSLREGASLREYELTMDELIETSRAAKNEDRSLHSILEFPAGSVRFNEDASRFLCVFDTATAEKPSHVDLMAQPKNAESKTQMKKLQRKSLKKLRDLLTQTADLSELFDGNLQRYMKH